MSRWLFSSDRKGVHVRSVALAATWQISAELSVASGRAGLQRFLPTPHDAPRKAVNAINARLERLQASLRDAKIERAQRFLIQSVIVTVAVAEALTEYIRMVGRYAERRHGELKQANEELGARHAELLKSGQELLEKFKLDPTDRALRREIDAAQKGMEAIQKTLRRSANTLQRDLAPGLAMIDEMAVQVRRLSEADQADGLKRMLKNVVENVRELYRAHPGLAAEAVVDAATWEKIVTSEIDEAADYYDAYARAGYQVTLALELMALALSEAPPLTAEEATRRANVAAADRLKAITARFTPS